MLGLVSNDHASGLYEGGMSMVGVCKETSVDVRLEFSLASWAGAKGTRFCLLFD